MLFRDLYLCAPYFDFRFFSKKFIDFVAVVFDFLGETTYEGKCFLAERYVLNRSLGMLFWALYFRFSQETNGFCVRLSVCLSVCDSLSLSLSLSLSPPPLSLSFSLSVCLCPSKRSLSA